jgi:hypothetical protein
MDPPSGNEPGSSHPAETNSNLAFGSIVIEIGKGQWTTVEEENFLSALQMHGKEWKKVAAQVKTRTVAQTRKHADHHFRKLKKAMGNKGGDGDILLNDLAPDTKKTPQKRKSKSSTKSQLRQAQQAQLAEAATNLIPHKLINAETLAAPHRIFSKQMNPTQTMEAESFHPRDGMDKDNTKRRTGQTMESVYVDSGKEDVIEQAVQSLEQNLAQGAPSSATVEASISPDEIPDGPDHSNSIEKKTIKNAESSLLEGSPSRKIPSRKAPRNVEL